MLGKLLPDLAPFLVLAIWVERVIEWTWRPRCIPEQRDSFTSHIIDGVHVEIDEGDDEAADVPRSCLHGCWAKLPLFEG